MTRDVRFDVYLFHNTHLRHVEFTTPSDRPSFQDIVSQIKLKCDPENKLDLKYSPLLYTNLEGDKVILNNDGDSLERFYTAICGQRSVFLEIPNWTNEKNEAPYSMNIANLNKMNFRGIENLFNVKVDRNGSREIQETASFHSASATFKEFSGPSKNPFPQKQKFPTQKGMLTAKRISGQEVWHLLLNGSQIMLPIEDNNFLSVSFSKDQLAHPALLWQNRSPEHFEARYQCERASFPAVVDNPANFCIPKEVAHLFSVCDDHKKSVSGQRYYSAERARLQPRPNQLSPGYPLLTPAQCESVLRSQISPHQQKLHYHSPKNSSIYQMVNPPLLQKPQTQQNPRSGPQNARPNLECNDEDSVPAWFPRHMEDFKKDLIADVEKMLKIRTEETVSQKRDEQLETEESTLEKNNPSKTVENDDSSNNTKEMIEGWEVVSEISQNDSKPNPLSGASDSSEQSGNVSQRFKEERPSIECKSPNYSNCTPEVFYDSDSSISLILDDTVEIDETVNKSDVIEIPRCFVRQFKESDEGTSNRVSVRVKRYHVSKSSPSEIKSDPNAEMVAVEAAPALTSPPSSTIAEAVPAPTSTLSSPIAEAVPAPTLYLSSPTKKTKNNAADCEDESNANPHSQPEQEKENPTNGFARCSTRRSYSENAYRPFLHTTKTEKRERDLKDDSIPFSPIAAKFSNSKCLRSVGKENSRRQFLQMKMKSRERASKNDSNPVSHSQPEQAGKANATAGCSNRKGTDSADTESSRRPQQTQPVNILHDKVFEMTNNVFKNVLNSVKIPHSNEMKESVQKVFEESMSAASRLIPNPLYAERVPPSENLNTSNRRQPAASNNETSPPWGTTASNDNENRSGACANENDDYSKYEDLPEKVKADLILLNEMGFGNNGHNLFLLSKYPDDLEKVVESLVNFAVI